MFSAIPNPVTLHTWFSPTRTCSADRQWCSISGYKYAKPRDYYLVVIVWNALFHCFNLTVQYIQEITIIPYTITVLETKQLQYLVSSIRVILQSVLIVIASLFCISLNRSMEITAWQQTPPHCKALFSSCYLQLRKIVHPFSHVFAMRSQQRKRPSYVVVYAVLAFLQMVLQIVSLICQHAHQRIWWHNAVHVTVG